MKLLQLSLTSQISLFQIYARFVTAVCLVLGMESVDSRPSVEYEAQLNELTSADRYTKRKFLNKIAERIIDDYMTKY